jgi:hypothetical protein
MARRVASAPDEGRHPPPQGALPEPGKVLACADQHALAVPGGRDPRRRGAKESRGRTVGPGGEIERRHVGAAQVGPCRRQHVLPGLMHGGRRVHGAALLPTLRIGNQAGQGA